MEHSTEFSTIEADTIDEQLLEDLIYQALN